MLVLRIKDKEDRKRVYRLKDSLTIGRAKDCDIRLDDPRVSRRHALVWVDNEGRVFLRDMQSRNGTLCDGRRVEECELKPGGVITVGDTNIVLEERIDEAELIGTTLGGYKLLEVVGRGGMGVVFKAVQLSLDRTVAVKVLNKSLVADEEFVERFQKEAKAAGNLNHPNLIQVHDFGHDKGYYFFSMEFVDGRTVSQVLKQYGRIPERIAVYIVREAAKALEYAHSRGIIHRDVKPGNIMVDVAGNVKVADLGIAQPLHLAQRESDEPEAVMGTPEYMSPEQAQGKPLDVRSDVYSLGATLYHMVTGRPPASGRSTQEILRQVVYEEPEDVRVLVPSASEELVRLVKWMMRKPPDKRIPHCGELQAIIERYWPTDPEYEEARRRHLVELIRGTYRPDLHVHGAARRPATERLAVAAVFAAAMLLGGAALVYYMAARRTQTGPVVGPDWKEGSDVIGDTATPPSLEKSPPRKPRPDVGAGGSAGEATGRQAKKTPTAAEKAFRKAEEVDRAHADDLDKRLNAWRKAVALCKGTSLEAEAEKRLRSVREEKLRYEHARLAAVVSRANLLAVKGRFVEAARLLKPFADGAFKGEVRSHIARFKSQYEAAFAALKDACDRAMKHKRYGEALEACDRFLRENGGGPRDGDVKAMKRAAEQKSRLLFKTVRKKVHEALAGFDFDSASVIVEDAMESLNGTSMEDDLEALSERVGTLRDLHFKVIDAINVAMEPRVLPFKLLEGRGENGVVKEASHEALSVGFGGVVIEKKWSELTAQQVLEVYRMYLSPSDPNARVELRAFMEEFGLL